MLTRLSPWFANLLTPCRLFIDALPLAFDKGLVHVLILCIATLPMITALFKEGKNLFTVTLEFSSRKPMGELICMMS
jgi:hypothetical protein